MRTLPSTKKDENAALFCFFAFSRVNHRDLEKKTRARRFRSWSFSCRGRVSWSWFRVSFSCRGRVVVSKTCMFMKRVSFHKILIVFLKGKRVSFHEMLVVFLEENVYFLIKLYEINEFFSFYLRILHYKSLRLCF